MHLHARTRTSSDASTGRNASRRTPTLENTKTTCHPSQPVAPLPGRPPPPREGGRQRHVRLISHTPALAATHSYATSFERGHLISKYWLANRRPKTLTAAKKSRIRTWTDSGKIRGFGCGFGIRNNTRLSQCYISTCTGSVWQIKSVV